MQQTEKTSNVFVGREELVEQVRDAVDASNLVVVHGSPGVGKSRLVVEALGDGRGKAAWVDVSMADGIDDLVAATSRSLDVEVKSDESAGAGGQRIGAALEAVKVDYVVFDDFDPVADVAAPRIEDWASRAKPTLIVTSRQRLNLPAARPVHVPPLGEEEAIEAFCEHVRQVRPGFSLEDHREGVEKLVDALDRLPYAIELAARRAHVLSPADMLHRLDERFSLLRNRQSGRVEAMDMALEWTWKWLAPAERQFLEQCCVLADSASAEALERIVHIEGDVSWLDVLDSLVAKSWLESEPSEELDGEVRFRLLNTVRAFVEQQMVDGTEEASRSAAKRRAAEYYGELAAEWGERVTGPDGPEALTRLEVDRAHLLQAAEYWVGREDERALQVVSGLRWVALLRGPIYRFRDLVEQAAALAGEHEAAEYEAILHDAAAQIALVTGRRERATSNIRRALQAAKGTSPQVEAAVGRTAGLVESASTPEQARDRLEDALEKADAADDDFLRARILERIGYVDIRLFNLTRAEQEFERANELVSGGRSPLFEADSVAGIAYVAHRQNRLESAIEKFEEVVRLHRENDAHTSATGALFNLGVSHHIVGALDEAESCIQKAIDDWRKLGLTLYVPAGQVRLAMVLYERGAWNVSRELLDEAIPEAEGVGDTQSGAMGNGFAALCEWLKSGEADLEALEHARAQIDAGSDPDAAAAFSVAQIASKGAHGDDRIEELNRIEELVALLSPSDRYHDSVLTRLLAIARCFDHCRLAHAAVDGANRREEAQQAVAELGTVLEIDETAELGEAFTEVANPFVRLLGRRAVEELESLGVAVELDVPSAEHVLEVHSNCHWYRVDDEEPVDLSARKAIRLILKSILQTHLDDPEAALDVEDLIEAGWPDEYMTFDAGRNRVYSAIKFLRNHGLKEIIETTDDGYRVAPDVDVQVAPVTGLRVS